MPKRVAAIGVSHWHSAYDASYLCVLQDLGCNIVGFPIATSASPTAPSASTARRSPIIDGWSRRQSRICCGARPTLRSARDLSLSGRRRDSVPDGKAMGHRSRHGGGPRAAGRRERCLGHRPVHAPVFGLGDRAAEGTCSGWCLSGFRESTARHSFFEADQVVIELTNEIDKDRLLDVAMALDHRFISGYDPEGIVGVEA
jgi:hypothetical protein